MSRRFAGTLGAAVLLALAWLGVQWAETRWGEAPQPEGPPAVFRFDKASVVGFRVRRDDLDVQVRRHHDQWVVEGHDWRPNQTMIRRVAHQLHELDARTAPLSVGEEGVDYGLGAARVDVQLRDGREVAFEVGDANPSGVSYYLRPIPGDQVMVVQRAAVGFAFEPLEAYREDRLVQFEVDEVERLTATVDGRSLAIERTGERTWRMTEPVAQPASREQVRRMLGRLVALRASRFVADHPDDLAQWGLAPPRHRAEVHLSDGRVVDLRSGAQVTGTDRPSHYLYLAGDDAVYVTRLGWLDDFRLDLESYRDRVLVPFQAAEVQSFTVRRDGVEVTLHRVSEGWVDELGPFPGATPRRVVTSATRARATTFQPEAGLTGVITEVVLEVPQGRTRLQVACDGAGDGCVARADEGPLVGVSDELWEVVDDLFRERRRRLRDGDAPVTP